jgi:ABC-type Na+ efflux pump permease subunit
MRAVIFILVIVILLVIAGIATGFLDINQIRGAKAPQVAGTGNGITTRGGQAPAFDVQTGSVKVGTQEKTVKVPTLVVEKPGQNQAAAATNNTM